LDAALHESAEDLYEHAPCGYLSTRPDGVIVRVNETFLAWTGLRRDALVGRRRFADLLTAGGQIYHETHYAPLLQMQGAVREIALEIVCADGRRLPVLVNSVLRADEAGRPLMIRTTVFDATDRKAFERELMAARERSRALAEQAEALAAENARLYERERRIARAMQRGLLAGDPPADPRFAIATRYESGVEALEVGGDWHDAFLLGTGELAVVVGDVVGRGLEAASAMGQLRSALRALAGRAGGPARVLEELERFVREFGVGRAATVALAQIDLATGVVRYACAGHPPPVVVAPGEPPELLWDGRSPPLDAFRDPLPRREASVVLAPGARLLLYTDGLIERRDRPLDDGLQALTSELAARAGVAPAQLVDELAEVLAGGDDAQDDVCLLCLAYVGAA
jgi:PAS domain S-box-containing protein